MVQVKVAKRDSSLAVGVPQSYAKEIGLAENAEAELSAESGRLAPTARHEPPISNLDALVSRITDVNRHCEITVGPAIRLTQRLKAG